MHAAVAPFAGWARLLAASSVVVAFTWMCAHLGAGEFERSLVARLNPDAPPWWLDRFIVYLADLSAPVLACAWIIWEAGYLAWRRWPQRGTAITWALRAFAPAVGIPLLFYYEPVHGHGDPTAGLVAMAVILWLAEILRRGQRETLRRAHLAFALVLVTVLLAWGADEFIARWTPYRHRPFHSVNAAWNEVLRVVPGEKVKYGNSYVSGHALYFFALATPLFCLARTRLVAVALLLWGAAVVYTRLYTASHFPSCALMGALLGISLGWLTVHTLVPGHVRVFQGAHPPGVRSLLFPSGVAAR